MATQNTTEAYDFALFEPKRELEHPEPQKQGNVIALPKEKLEQNRHPKLRPVKVVSMLLFIGMVMATVCTLIYGQVRLSELTTEIGEKTELLAQSQSAYVQMKMKSEARLSLDAVEEYAENELGMRKIEQNQVEYISLGDGDKSEVVSPDDGGDFLSEIWAAVVQLLS